MAQIIADSLRQAWINFLDSVRSVLPNVVAMLSIIVLGWLIVRVFGFVVRRVLGWLKFAALSRRLGAGDVLKMLDQPSAWALAGSVIFWFVWAAFLLSGFDALKLPGMESLAAGFVHFVPRLIVALVILALGFAAANFAWRAALLAAVNARLPSARLLSAAVRFLIIILTLAMALEQIAVATTVVLTAFAIAFGAVMLGLAIAFGIGGGQVARRMLEQPFPEREKEDPGGLSPL